jgi:hypothetical protein
LVAEFPVSANAPPFPSLNDLDAAPDVVIVEVLAKDNDVFTVTEAEKISTLVVAVIVFVVIAEAPEKVTLLLVKVRLFTVIAAVKLAVSAPVSKYTSSVDIGTAAPGDPGAGVLLQELVAVQFAPVAPTQYLLAAKLCAIAQKKSKKIVSFFINIKF